jgi:hypothetical protein
VRNNIHAFIILTFVYSVDAASLILTLMRGKVKNDINESLLIDNRLLEENLQTKNIDSDANFETKIKM